MLNFSRLPLNSGQAQPQPQPEPRLLRTQAEDVVWLRLSFRLCRQSGWMYSEPFVGRGNIFFPAASTLDFSRWQLNDVRMAPSLNAIISHGSTIEVPEHTREQFELQKVANRSSDPTAIILAPYLTYSGAGYAANYRSAQGSPLRHHYENTLRCAHQILTKTRALITSGDWTQAIVDLGDDDFAYFDPPYLGAKVHRYGQSDMNHPEMIDVLKKPVFVGF